LATQDKDFKVKNGLQVGGPTNLVNYSSASPSNPFLGQLWISASSLYAWSSASTWVLVGDGNSGEISENFLTEEAAASAYFRISSSVSNFGTIKTIPATEDVIADLITDELTFAANNGIILNATASVDQLTISTNATESNSSETIIKRDADKSFSITSIDFDQTTTEQDTLGKLQWNDSEGTLNLGLQQDVVLQVGQIFYTRVANETGSSIFNGQMVYVVGAGESTPGHQSHPLVSQFIADGSINPDRVIGVATHDIVSGSHGYVTTLGMVRGLNTASYAPGTTLYADPDNYGGLVSLEPLSPDRAVVAGIVVESSSYNGSILVNPRTYPSAYLIPYDNSDAEISATNVKGALDELSLGKADISALSSNIIFYATTASSDIVNYNKLVTSLTDPSFNTASVAVNVPSTGSLSSSSNDDGTSTELVGQLVSASGLLEGNPGIFGITTIGKISRSNDTNVDGGSKDYYASFYFKVFKRNSSGVETLIATADKTSAIQAYDRPSGGYEFEEFSDTALIQSTTFSISDRIVIKYYADTVQADENKCAYLFQFGGNNPVRTVFPVPVSVIPVKDASGIQVDTSLFNGILSGADTTVQAALNTIDSLDVLPDQNGNSGKYLTTNGLVATWDNVDATTLGGNLPEYFLSAATASATYATNQDFNNLMVATHMGIY
jgi:hypothetical protein